MGIYISSKGEQKDTGEMAYPYLQSAYAKAAREGNEDNMRALQSELDLRDNQATPDDGGVKNDSNGDERGENEVVFGE